MKYVRTFVCFANSRKHSGRCVAGKEWLGGRPGEWVRVVSDWVTHELSAEDRRYENGDDPQLLDVVRVPCLRPSRPRTRAKTMSSTRTFIGSRRRGFRGADLCAWLDTPETLWTLGEASYACINNRVAVGRENGVSLYLIRVPCLRLWVGSKAPGHSDSKRIVRGEFNYRGAVYRLAVTDPVIEIKYLSGEDGQYEIPQAVLCVSLGDPFQGYYYKLIASVLYGERFA